MLCGREGSPGAGGGAVRRTRRCQALRSRAVTEWTDITEAVGVALSRDKPRGAARLTAGGKRRGGSGPRQMVGDLGLPCRLQDDLVDEAWMNARWSSSPRSRTPTSGKAGSRPCVAWHQAFTSTSAMGTCAKDASTTPGLQLDAGLAKVNASQRQLRCPDPQGSDRTQRQSRGGTPLTGTSGPRTRATQPRGRTSALAGLPTLAHSSLPRSALAQS